MKMNIPGIVQAVVVALLLGILSAAWGTYLEVKMLRVEVNMLKEEVDRLNVYVDQLWRAPK